jgi:hypothetical protein
MEAANCMKNQSVQRKEKNETNVIKHAEPIHLYDAELNAATASIISLPLENPVISTHADVSAKQYICSLLILMLKFT